MPTKLVWTILGVIAIGLLIKLVTKQPAEQATASSPAASVSAPNPPPPTSPNAGDMEPGEVRPGPTADTLRVQPFGPGPAKIISKNYRVPTHRDDARITRTDDGGTRFEQAIALAGRLHDESAAPEDDVQILDAILGFYRLVYRSNPVAGENIEVMRALTGKNPHKISVFPSDHPDLNKEGELLDRWGSPYYFHALSATRMDIWSAGPDGKRNTGDDLKLLPPTEAAAGNGS